MNDLPIFAQVNAELPEPTSAEVGAGLLVIMALGGSLIMLITWGLRASAGKPLFPPAARKPLFVPPGLTVVGGVLCGLMALLVLVATFLPNPPKPKLSDAAAESSATTEESDEEESETTDAVLAEEDTDEEIDEATRAKMTETARNTLWQNLTFSMGEFLVFGLAVLLVQQGHQRSIGRTEARAVETSNLAAVVNPFPDLDSAPETVVTTSSANPYSSPANELTSEENPEDSVAEVPAERWNVITETKFAFQAFLLAYLPTAFLRILMVALTEDTKSHPFLEMLQDQPPTDILLLIFVSAVFIAPIVEELLFRVILMGGMQQMGYRTGALIASSILFCMAHGFPDSIALMPLALVLAVTYQQRRSYRTVVLIHFFFNGFNMAIAGISMLAS